MLHALTGRSAAPFDDFDRVLGVNGVENVQLGELVEKWVGHDRKAPSEDCG